jgi:hypothetical protein
LAFAARVMPIGILDFKSTQTPENARREIIEFQKLPATQMRGYLVMDKKTWFV